MFFPQISAVFGHWVYFCLSSNPNKPALMNHKQLDLCLAGLYSRTSVAQTPLEP